MLLEQGTTFLVIIHLLACIRDGTKPWLSPSACQNRNPCPGLQAVYQRTFNINWKIHFW